MTHVEPAPELAQSPDPPEAERLVQGHRPRVRKTPSAIHATATNAELARTGSDLGEVHASPAVARFAARVADKPSVFHAPKRRVKKR